MPRTLARHQERSKNYFCDGDYPDLIIGRRSPLEWALLALQIFGLM
jgi:hypothetical protein